MKLKSIVLASVAMCAVVVVARETVVCPLPLSAYNDTEVSTNVAFDVGSELGREFRLRLALDACSSNNVTVAFGNDADGDGQLSASESDLEVGWDCGAWFFRDRLARVSDSNERGEARRALVWNTTLNANKKPKYILANDSEGTTFALRATDGMFRNDWNLMRVVVRGLGEQESVVVTRVRDIGMRVLIR